MPGLPHHRRSACLLDCFREGLGTFHVEDYRLTLSRSRDYVARVDDQDLISPDDLALFVDHADAICVTVEGNSNISAIAFNSCNEIAEILRDSWIGMVVGKRSVALAEKTAYGNSELLEEQRRDQCAGALSLVGNH